MKAIKNRISLQDNVSTGLIIIYYLSRSIYIYNGETIYYTLAFIVGLTSFFYVFWRLKEINTEIFISLFVLYFLMILSAIITKNIQGGILFNFQYIGITLLLVHSKLNIKFIKISFYILSLFVISFILQGLNPAEVFYFSRNQISSVIIVQSTLYYISCIENDSKFTSTPAMLTLIISFWSIGRSGIISSILLLIIILASSKKNPTLKSPNNIRIKYSISILTIILVSIFTWGSISTVLMNVSNNIEIAIERLISEGVGQRSIIVSEYIKSASENFLSIIFGGAINTNNFLVTNSFSDNLHISYLGIHAYYGLIGGLIIFFLFLKSFNYLTIRKYWTQLLLLIVLLIRISTDSLAFPGMFDPLIYYFIFYEHHKKYLFNRIDNCEVILPT